MCGIVGYVGRQKAASIILEGLKRLEYRGYDSAGLCVLQGGKLDVAKKAGRVDVLVKECANHRFNGSTGIGHTRWATHGGVTDANAHPHISSDGKFALIHNGVIENYSGMKTFLTAKGYTFKSETDTEALCNLIAYHYAKEPVMKDGGSRFLESVRKSLRHVEGTYGIAVLCIDCPEEIVAARKASPLVLGVGDQEYIVASDASAIVSHTQSVVYLKDGELVHLTPRAFSITTLDQADVSPVVDKITWTISEADLNGYTHFMEKEIFEQPLALENTMRGRFSEDGSTAQFGGLNLNAAEFRQIDRFLFCACGSAWHACLVAEHLIETYARVPVEVDYASEFRYRNAPLDRNTLCWVISQSGETIDTLAAMREAKRKGHRVLALNNVVGSTIVFEPRPDGGFDVNDYVGGYDDWIRQRRAATEGISAKATRSLGKAEAQQASPRRRKLSFKEQQELASLPGTIETLERDLQALHAAMAGADYFRKPGDVLARDQSRLKDLQGRLENAFSRWHLLEEPTGG